MAIARPSILGPVSGRLGGTEVSASGQRAVVKSRKSRHPRRTSASAAAAATHQAALRRWHSLTTGDRTAWTVVAGLRDTRDRLGTPRKLTGLQLFLTIPRDYRFLDPIPYQDRPPVRPTPQIPAFTASLSAAGTYLVTTPTWWSADISFESLYIARFRRSMTAPTAYTWRKIATIEKTSDTMNYTAYFALAQIALLEDEIVRLAVSGWNVNSWPTARWQKNFTVTA